MLSTKMTAFSIIRWLSIILLIMLSVALLITAFGALWVSGGPPTDYPNAWLFSSIKNLCFSQSSMLAAIVVYIFVRKNRKMKNKKLGITLIGCAMLSASFPYMYEGLKIDSCLDSGGSWDKMKFECNKTKYNQYNQ